MELAVNKNIILIMTKKGLLIKNKENKQQIEISEEDLLPTCEGILGMYDAVLNSQDKKKGDSK